MENKTEEPDILEMERVVRRTVFPKNKLANIVKCKNNVTLYCCVECQFRSDDKEKLENHLLVHNEEYRYLCGLCGAGLKRREHLERHTAEHQEMRPHVCRECGKGFKRKEHLNIHFTIHTGYKGQECFICKKSFYRKDHLQKHMQTHSKLFMEHIVPTSDQELDIKQEFIEYDSDRLDMEGQDQSTEPSYIKIENSERPFLCLVCNKTYKRKDHLKLHSLTHLKKDKVCRECGKAFHRDQQLLVHMNTHLNMLPNETEEPDDEEVGEPIVYDHHSEMIVDETSLLVPIPPKYKSEVRKHECMICHKRFKRKQHLKVHGNVHRKEQNKEYTVWCSDCHRGFRTNHEFENHPCMPQQYDDDSPVKIETLCDVGYVEDQDEEELNPPQEAKKENKYPLEFVEVDLGAADEHDYDHEEYGGEAGGVGGGGGAGREECSLPVPQRVYVCKYCGKPFKRKDHYKIHLHIHTGVRSFFCPECGKGFYRKDHMQKHVQVHAKTNNKLKPKKTLPQLLRITNMAPRSDVKPEITIHAPSNAKLRVPLQIKVPYQMVMSTDSGEQCAVTINPGGHSSEMILS